MSSLNPSVFAGRRAALLAQLPVGSSVVLFAAREAVRNQDVLFPFRQDSYFWYYTGFPEPDAVALLHKTAAGNDYILFNAVRDPVKEIWDGKIIGQEEAVRDYGADISYPPADLRKLPELLKDSTRIYTVLGVKEQDDGRITDTLRRIHASVGRGGAPIEGIFDIRRIADEMRLIKTEEELQQIRQACAVSIAGHLAALRHVKPGLHEYSIQAVVEGEYRRYGCHWSFPAIAAAGANACCLHYHDNNAPLRDGDLLMLDSGAEYQHYAGDISRTMPINGHFSAPQQALYELVLTSQKAAIDMARPGVRHLEVHGEVCRILTQGLIDLGLLHGELNELLETQAYKKYYVHGTGHWMGLDVHDVGIYMIDGLSRAYAPGMVVTVEPGLYIPADDSTVDEKWRGIGIRIEDDIAITAGAAEVLTADLPKEVAEIEALVQGK